MKVIHADNVGEAFKKGVGYLLEHGSRDTSRNGTVLRAPYPVTTIYRHPRRRVLLNPLRRANPFFHLMEAMWMLAGRKDVESVARYNKRMREFSDDGRTFWGAYGWRWCRFFGYDQLACIVAELRANPTSRRCVLSMWNADRSATGDGVHSSCGTHADLLVASANGKDVPCNTHAYFLRRADGALDMTVCNRSNDAIWGCYGANAVHFSILHEYMAALTEMPLGRYYQISNDLHAYTDVYNEEKLAEMTDIQDAQYPIDNPMSLLQMSESTTAFAQDLAVLFSRDVKYQVRSDFQTAWFANLVLPMARAWALYKYGDKEAALGIVVRIPASDWSAAAQSWLEHR